MAVQIDGAHPEPFAELFDLLANELAYWRGVERLRGPLPGGGLDQVWDQCLRVCAIEKRYPGLQRGQALRCFLPGAPSVPLGDRIALFDLVWSRLRRERVTTLYAPCVDVRMKRGL